jgi:D-ribose pyranose/furanose isomerase RbsD
LPEPTAQNDTSPQAANGASAPAPLLVFIHSPRTGGMTLRTTIRCQYQSAEVFTINAKPLRQGEESLLPFDLPDLQDLSGVSDEVRVVQGHVPFGIHERLNRPAKYVTLLRQPVARTVSLYRYRQERGYGGEAPWTEFPGSLEEYLNYPLIEADNAQTRLLSGLNPPFGECTKEMFEIARTNLRKQFLVVGLTERFEESVLLMGRALRWPNGFFVPENATSAKTDAAPAGAVLRRIEKLNQWDLRLHREATQLLDSAVKRAGPEFASELQTYQQLNTRFGRVVRGEPIGRPAAGGARLSREQRLVVAAAAQVYTRDREIQQLETQERLSVRKLEQWGPKRVRETTAGLEALGTTVASLSTELSLARAEAEAERARSRDLEESLQVLRKTIRDLDKRLSTQARQSADLTSTVARNTQSTASLQEGLALQAQAVEQLTVVAADQDRRARRFSRLFLAQQAQNEVIASAANQQANRIGEVETELKEAQAAQEEQREGAAKNAETMGIVLDKANRRIAELEAMLTSRQGVIDRLVQDAGEARQMMLQLQDEVLSEKASLADVVEQTAALQGEIQNEKASLANVAEQIAEQTAALQTQHARVDSALKTRKKEAEALRSASAQQQRAIRRLETTPWQRLVGRMFPKPKDEQS